MLETPLNIKLQENPSSVEPSCTMRTDSEDRYDEANSQF